VVEIVETFSYFFSLFITFCNFFTFWTFHYLVRQIKVNFFAFELLSLFKLESKKVFVQFTDVCYSDRLDNAAYVVVATRLGLTLPSADSGMNRAHSELFIRSTHYHIFLSEARRCRTEIRNRQNDISSQACLR
jgi:hypothetical protein